MNDKNLNRLLDKLRLCSNYNNLFGLEKDFNSVGLTLQPTFQNWIALCKIEEGKPSAKSIMEDYMFISPIEKKSDTIPSRTIECITDFVCNNAGKPASLEDSTTTWRSGVKTYGQRLRVVNEDINHIVQFIQD